MPKRYKPAFKAEVVRLRLDEKRSYAWVSSDLGFSETPISRWVNQARIDRGVGPDDALTTQEKAELRRFRREVKTLKMEREILKKTAVNSNSQRNTSPITSAGVRKSRIFLGR